MRLIWYSCGSRTSTMTIGSPRSSRCLQLAGVMSSVIVSTATSPPRAGADAAELLVVDQLGHGRMRAADRAVGVLAQLQLAEAHPQRVVDQEPADQRLAGAEDQLDRLGRLDRADDAGQHAEHAAFGAARHQSGRRRLGIQAAVARAVLGREHRCLALEPEDAAVDVRLAEQHARVVHEIARREVVGAVEDDVVRLEQLQRVRRAAAPSRRSRRARSG